MFKLPSYDECVRICQMTNHQVFYESKFIIDGYRVSVFNYRYATYNDFVDYNGFELRGLTFVFNSDGTLYQRFPLLGKFFNINENESTLYESLKLKKIFKVYTKEDGSIISFIKLPNGKILAKSKTSFESEQANLAQSEFENNELINKMVTSWLDSGNHPIFELVGPKNKIVVDYESTKLLLIGLRSNEGGYLDLESFQIPKATKIDLNLDQMLDLKTSLESCEGWVVEFEGGQKVKIKTDWYFKLHRILTDYTNREDYLIDMVINEKIDDILSQLPFGSESRVFVEKVITTVHTKVIEMKSDCQLIINQFDGDMKEFALLYKKHPYFNIIGKVIRGGDLDTLLKESVIRMTYRLREARLWLWGKKFTD